MTNDNLLRRSSQLLIGIDGNGNLKPLNIDADGNLQISTTSQSVYYQVINSIDLTKTFNYADAGTPDERIISIQYSSSTIETSFTETYNYAGSSGSYRVISLERTQP